MKCCGYKHVGWVSPTDPFTFEALHRGDTKRALKTLLNKMGVDLPG